MLSLLILIGLALVIGYYLGRGQVGERLRDWYSGWRAPKEAESQEDEAEGDEEA